MIRSFRHRGLRQFFTDDNYRGIPAQQGARIQRMLDWLDAASKPEDMNLPGYKFHALKGQMKGRYAVAVTGNWRITFAFDSGDAIDVDFEDYH